MAGGLRRLFRRPCGWWMKAAMALSLPQMARSLKRSVEGVRVKCFRITSSAVHIAAAY